MLDGALNGEEIREDSAPCECGERERLDELLGTGRQDGLYLVPTLHEQAGQFGGFVSGDAATNAQNDPHTGLQDWFFYRFLRGLAGGAVLHQAAPYLFH